MPEIRFTIGDIRTPKELKEFAAFLNHYATWMEAQSGQSLLIENQLALNLNVDNFNEQTEHRSMIDWMVMAWEHIGRDKSIGATGDEIYEAMVQLGFKSTADDPVNAVKSSLRYTRRFVKVGVNSKKAILWAYHPDETPPIIDTHIADRVTSKFMIDDPDSKKTNRVVKYVEQILNQSLRKRATNETLAKLLIEAGWETKSSNPASVVGATLRKYPEFTRIDGMWTFSQEYYEIRGIQITVEAQG